MQSNRIIPHAVSQAGANSYGGGSMTVVAVGVSLGRGEVAVGVAADTVEVAVIKIMKK